jgi:predicted lysophospholipase L1 biosynthesis ABC-type transport system permease subunit
MEVVGRAVFPQVEDSTPLADGAYLHPDDVERVGLGDGFRTLVVGLRPGADVQPFVARMTEMSADGEAPSLPVPPSEVEKLEQVESLPRVLAGFLTVLGIIAVAHSLVVSVRRRAADFAVLRALGFRPNEVRTAVSWQAASLGVVGAAIGLPLGILLGRFAWSRVTASIGVLEVQRFPVSLFLLAIPTAAVLALAIALVPARRAARIHPAEVLRTE